MKAQGRPRSTTSTGHHDRDADQSYTDLAQQLRVAFEAMPPAKQAETVARVRETLDSERRQNRKRPSPLAIVALRVYNIRVEWLPLDIQQPPAIEPPAPVTRPTFDELLAAALRTEQPGMDTL